MSSPIVHEFTALVPAGGTGSRLGGSQPKQFMPLAGRPILAWTIDALLEQPWIGRVAVVVSSAMTAAERHAVDSAVGESGGRLEWIAAAGARRRDTVLDGLGRMRVNPDASWVMVHDAARPGLPADVLARLRDAIEAGAPGALAALPVADTVKRAVPDSAPARVAATIPRDGLWLAQTPQVFRMGELRAALTRFADVTDEAAAMELSGVSPVLVRGDWRNLKVTTPGDLALMAALFSLRADGRPGDPIMADPGLPSGKARR